MKSSRLLITPFVSILKSELDFSFVRSSGPGGQNVNKVNSKAVLRWNLRETLSMPVETRDRLVAKLESKMTTDGDLIVTSDSSRDQLQNKEACTEKFVALLKEALFIPKNRKKTKVSYSRKLKNEASKKHHSEKKRMRKADY